MRATIGDGHEEIDIDCVRSWVEEAGRIVLADFRRTGITVKEDGSPATPADYASESYLRSRVMEKYPGHAILGEEEGSYAADSEYLWAIDPIDGTRSYASGLPIWGVSVGVLRRGQPLAGVFYMPAVGERYWADAERAYFNGEPLPPCAPPSPDSPLAFVAAPSEIHLTYDIEVPIIRVLGSAAANLAYVARGTALAALCYNVSLWDLAGTLPMLGHTGAEIVYLSGEPFDAEELASGGKVHEPLVAARPDMIEYVRARVHRR